MLLPDRALHDPTPGRRPAFAVLCSINVKHTAGRALGFTCRYGSFESTIRGDTCVTNARQHSDRPLPLLSVDTERGRADARSGSAGVVLARVGSPPHERHTQRETPGGTLGNPLTGERGLGAALSVLYDPIRKCHSRPR